MLVAKNRQPSRTLTAGFFSLVGNARKNGEYVKSVGGIDGCFEGAGMSYWDFRQQLALLSCAVLAGVVIFSWISKE